MCNRRKWDKEMPGNAKLGLTYFSNADLINSILEQRHHFEIVNFKLIFIIRIGVGSFICQEIIISTIVLSYFNESPLVLI